MGIVETMESGFAIFILFTGLIVILPLLYLLGISSGIPMKEVLIIIAVIFVIYFITKFRRRYNLRHR